MDNLTKAQRRKNMQNMRSSKTNPEKQFAKELRKRKIYFAQNVSSIIGKPDFVFRKKKVIVFIDSCFWHKCPRHYIQPKSNLNYWRPKIARNVKRDKQVNRILKKEGWKVLRIWEHELKEGFEKSFKKAISYIL